jgi:DNA-binding LacI/PurR family transcriptional regulator
MESLTALDRDRGIALYKQLAEILRKHILDGTPPGETELPTELELSASYGVSRGTVRQALRLLSDEGLIERLPGRGTFVRHREPSASISHDGERSIGVIIPSAHDQLSLRILVGVESVAKHRRYHVVFNHSNDSLEQEEKDVQRLRSAHVTGAILFPVSDVEHNETIWQLHAQGFPLVLVDRYFAGLDCDYVVADNFGGAYRATEHLVLMGHAQIGFVHESAAGFKTTSVRDRYLGYRQALDDYGLAFEEQWLSQVERAPVSLEQRKPSASCVDYLRSPHRPQAVFAVNDGIALALIAAAAYLGLSVPDDLAIVGFDNLGVASQIHPPLTTVNQPQTDIGIRAAQLLLDRIEGRNGPPEHIVLSTNLVVRDSCGARSHKQGALSRKEERL